MVIADLHIHSKYSRATSSDCVPAALDFWARRKGIQLVGTGDFTHPAWRSELAEALVPAEEGLYTLKPELVRPGPTACAGAPRFVVSGEISSIYKKKGKVRKVHNLIVLPSLEAAQTLSQRLEAIGNIHSDGRPILGLDCRDLLEITLEAVPSAIFIPAHIWTPHFSLFGAFSGFDAIEDCFEDLTDHIYALETGLSSDPPMNWRLSALDRFHLVSNSDAHSPSRLGREANLLDIQPSYPNLEEALRTGRGLAGTIEVCPQEGKYFFDGHRNCHQCLSPGEAAALDNRCPVCGKALTTGVLHRVEELADRPEGYVRPNAPAYERLTPLPEVIAAALGIGPGAKRTAQVYETMLTQLGPEFYILRQASIEDIAQAAGPCVAEGIRRMRAGQVQWRPGYDGAYGELTLLSERERQDLNGQVTLFAGEPPKAKKRTKTAPIPKTARSETTPNPPLPADTLNEAQQSAAASACRAAAVTAGPGTGKTKALVARIQYLIERQGVRPSEITAVTFTNRAAEELRERLAAALGGKRALRGLTAGTFHAIALELLSQEKPVRLAGEFESLELAGQALRALGVKAAPRRLLQEVSRRKNGLPPEEPELNGVCEFYARRLAEQGLMDYDDLLLRALAWGEGAEEASLRRFTHLLVDEFQDCNGVQYRLVKTWNRAGRSLFVIGDPDQSIYAFRGSRGDCFARLAEDFPGLHTVSLTQNYRSTPEILGCALAAIAPNGGVPRTLVSTRPAGAKVRLIQAGDDRGEAIFTAKEIRRLVGGVDMLEAHQAPRPERVYSFSEIGVCCRTRRQLRLLEQCLRRDDIPCVIAGREDWLQDDIVRGALCFFRLLLDPEDLLCLDSCLRLVWQAPGDLVRAVCASWARIPGSAGERLAAAAEDYAAVPALQPWLNLAAHFAPSAGREKPWKLLERWAVQAGCTGSDPLDRLQHMALFYPTMPALLEGLTLGGEGDLRRRSGRELPSGAVTLMTLHAAKGLEFPAVVLCGLRQGLVPLESGRAPADLEEERRLFYVGLSRAGESLILLTSGQPSPFLADLPEAMIERGAALRAKPPASNQLSLFS